MQLNLANNSLTEGVSIFYVVLTGSAAGGADDQTGISTVRMFKNGSQIASGVYNASSGVVTMSGAPALDSLGIGTNQTYVITDDFAVNAPQGTYSMSLAANGDVQGVGQSSGRALNVTGASLTGASIVIANATFTPTNTPTNTPSFTPSFTPTDTPTFTLTPTFTPVPADHLAWLGPVAPFTAGTAAPVTIQVQSAAGQPTTFLSDITINLSSSSLGENKFSLTAGGSAVGSVNLSAGTSQTAVYYQDDLASNSTTLTALAVAAISTPSVQLPIAVNPGPYVKLQVLAPGQTADPGKPTADPTGKLGNPITVFTGNPVTAVINAVDQFFNLVNINHTLALTFSDPSVPAQSPTLAAGTVSPFFAFINPGSQSVTATDGGIKGVSDPIQVQQGVNSTLMNVVHASPNLSTVIAGQAVTVMTFILKVQNGTHDILFNDLIVHARDQSGAGIPMNTAFQGLTLVCAAQVYPLAVGSASAVTLGPLPGAFKVLSSGGLAVTLIADISANPTAHNAALYVDGVGFQASDSIGLNAVASTSYGDPTGFPMSSALLVFSNGDLASSYGNYPNTFRAGSEKTTIEFYLQSASTVSLTLYDVMGSRVNTLLDHQLLQPGLQRVTWDGRNGLGGMVVNGVYYAQLDASGTKLLLKVAVVK